MSFLLTGLIVIVSAMGLWGYDTAKESRKDLREESCRADRIAISKARSANEALANSLIAVAVDPENPQDRVLVDQFLEELGRQQEQLLALPPCE